MARSAWVKAFLRHNFEFFQNFGVDILPHHFYSEVPDIRSLRSTEGWKSPRSMCSVNGLPIDGQASKLREWVPSSLRDHLMNTDIYYSACRENGEEGFGPIEAEALYAFIVSQRPARVVQVGCGVATAVILAAARYAEYSPEMICIDPYPTTFLKAAAARALVKLHEVPAQLVDLRVLCDTGVNGLLFVDSTHTVKPGSEVNRLVLEVLPRTFRMWRGPFTSPISRLVRRGGSRPHPASPVDP